MQLAQLPAGAAQPSSPFLYLEDPACLDLAAQEPFEFVASLLCGEDTQQSPAVYVSEARQNEPQPASAQSFPQQRLPPDGARMGLHSPSRGNTTASSGLRGEFRPVWPVSQQQPPNSSGRQRVESCNASHLAVLPSCQSQAPSASLLGLHSKEIPKPMQPFRTHTPSTDASPCHAQGSIPSHLLDQLAVGAALLARGHSQLPGSATMPEQPSSASIASSRMHACSSLQVPASVPGPGMASTSSDVNTGRGQHESMACSSRQSGKRSRCEPQVGMSPAGQAYGPSKMLSKPHLPSERKHQPSFVEPACPAAACSLHPLLSHQQRRIATQLNAVSASTHASPELTGSHICALQGLARARGLPVHEIASLKQRNLQVIHLRGEWRDYCGPGGKSLLDMYDAFGRRDMSFSFPLMLNGQQQSVSLGFIVQQDLASLYMQAVGGLARFASQASSLHSLDSQMFTKGVCQSLALVTCAFETPRHLMRLFTQYVCKSQSDPRSHANGAAHMAFLEQQLGQEWKDSISDAQRTEAKRALLVHREFVDILTSLRAEALQHMHQALNAELQGSLDPERLLQLSDKAHSLSVILGLAQETRLQLARKMIYEILSPWQWGHISACFFPIMPDIVQCAKYIAGDEPASPLPALSSRQCYAYSAIAVREQAAASG